MSDPNPSPGPPLVIRVTDEPPLVLPVASATPTAPKRPRPGFLEACLLTVGFAVVLFGTIFVFVGGTMLYLVLFGGPGALQAKPGSAPGTAEALTPELRDALAVSVPAGYAAGLAYTVLVFRLVAGRGWTREAGLRRLPPHQLILALLSLPGFVVLSNSLAELLGRWLDPLVYRATGLGGLGDTGQALQETFGGYHWSFAVLAIGAGPGLVEELWCRGFLGRGLVGRYGWTAGVILTSLFFGTLHGWPPSYVLTTAAMGACLHFTYAASRSLWVPIAVHLVNNSFAAMESIKAIPTEQIERAGTAYPVLTVVLAGGLLLSVGLAMWTTRARLVRTSEDGPDPATYRGVMVPPGESGLVVADPSGLGATGGVAVAAAVGTAGALLWLFFG